MVTIDEYGVEIIGDNDPYEYSALMEQIEMDFEGHGINTACTHPDFWFDRTIDYCVVCEDQHMDSVCVECNLTTCQIENGV